MLLSVLTALLVPVLPAQDDALRARRVTPIVEVVRAVGPAVVNIRSTGVTEIRDPLFRFFYGPNQRTQSLGSGVLIDPDGYVVTNAHVVQNATQEVSVTLGDGSEPTAADVIWIDPGNDLALLKVRAGGPYPWVRLAAADDVMIGETVVALGNPYGFDNTVSSGIVSATNRALRTPAGLSFVDFIQTDAALHPGNSGGPLVNINGEVIGINTMVQSGTEAIGFAIPAERVQKILLERLTNYTQINGVYFGARVRPGPAAGARVHFVEEDSPAERAGIRPGDLVRAVGDRAVATAFDFNKSMLGTRPGEQIDLELLRDGRTVRCQVRLETYSQNPQEILWQRLGLQVTDRDPYNRRFHGVLVREVRPGGPGAEIQLARGDLIQQVNGIPVDSYESFYYAVTESTEPVLAIDVQRYDPERRENLLYEGKLTVLPLRGA